MIRAYKTELDPNNVQRTVLLRYAGVARFAYNWGLARRIEEFEKTGKSSNAIEQHRQLNRSLKLTILGQSQDVFSSCPIRSFVQKDQRFQGDRLVYTGG